jgi:hypothetical protein
MAQTKNPKTIKTLVTPDSKNEEPSFIESLKPESELPPADMEALAEFKKNCQKMGGDHIATPIGDLCVTFIANPQSGPNKGGNNR